jgi:hypothetical protein
VNEEAANRLHHYCMQISWNGQDALHIIAGDKLYVIELRGEKDENNLHSRLSKSAIEDLWGFLE